MTGARVARAWSLTGALASRAVREFFDDGCTQRDAAIAYYALLRGKAIDLVLVAGFGLAAAVSLGLSLAVSLTASLADKLAGCLGTGIPVTAVAWGARLVPLALSGAIVALLFAIVPAHNTRLRVGVAAAAR